MSGPDVFARTYAAARTLQRRIYGGSIDASYSQTERRMAAELYEKLASDARELARMLDRCALAAETAQDATGSQDAAA